MILFAPAYDEQTELCLPVANHLSASIADALLLAAADANRGNLLRALQSGDRCGCFILSHGCEDEISGQHDIPALLPNDFRALPRTPVFAYACNSAFFGRHGADEGWIWWGYDKTMVPPPRALSRDDVESVFRYIAHRFHACASAEQVAQLIEEIRTQCQTLVSGYLRREAARVSSMVFFMQLWTRLRVWVPGHPHPIKHDDSWSADLDSAI